MLKVRVRKKKVRLRVDSKEALEAAAKEIERGVNANIAAGGGLESPKDGGRALHRSGQLAASVKVTERKTPKGAVKFTVGPSGRRSGPDAGGTKRNAGVAIILEATLGAKIGLGEGALDRAKEAAERRFAPRLEVTGDAE